MEKVSFLHPPLFLKTFIFKIPWEENACERTTVDMVVLEEGARGKEPFSKGFSLAIGFEEFFFSKDFSLAIGFEGRALSKVSR